MKVLNAQETRESGLSLQQYSTLTPAGEVFGRVDGVGVSDLGQILLFFCDVSTGKSYSVRLLEDYYSYQTVLAFQQFINRLDTHDLCQIDIKIADEGIFSLKTIDIVEKAEKAEVE